MRMTAEEYRLLNTGNPPKYRNKPTERVTGSGNTIRFDSQKEAGRYDELMLMLEGGFIKELRIHPAYTLQEPYTTPGGGRVKRETFTADFSYVKGEWPYADEETRRWTPVVEDVKSKATKTQAYKLRKNRMMERYGIAVTEV